MNGKGVHELSLSIDMVYKAYDLCQKQMQLRQGQAAWHVTCTVGFKFVLYCAIEAYDGHERLRAESSTAGGGLGASDMTWDSSMCIHVCGKSSVYWGIA